MQDISAFKSAYRKKLNNLPIAIRTRYGIFTPNFSRHGYSPLSATGMKMMTNMTLNKPSQAEGKCMVPMSGNSMCIPCSINVPVT